MYEELVNEIIEGRRLGKEDDLTFLIDGDLESLCQGADKIRKELCGNQVDLCTIINGRAGRCSENCRFCAQSSHHHTGAEEYDVMDVDSFVKASLYIILILTLASSFGVDAASIVALLGSAGVAVGLAVQGSLSNLAGGVLILLLKPFKVGDYIVEGSSGKEGTVKEIQIFHTILTTGDNKVIYIPNGAMSSGVVTNYNTQTTRRVEWIVGVDYGEDYNKVQQIVRDILTADKRILTDPAPFIALHALDASSVNVVARVWVNTADYWGVYFDINKTIYETFNEKGINFPFPQLTVHQGN